MAPPYIESCKCIPCGIELCSVFTGKLQWLPGTTQLQHWFDLQSLTVCQSIFLGSASGAIGQISVGNER